MATTPRACLVSPGHLGSNPRLVKEADALAEAGYKVHVISGDSFPGARERDQSILKRAKWSSQIIPVRPNRAAYLCRRLRQLACRWLFNAGIKNLAIAERAHHPLVPALAAAAAATPADIYIGHCLAGLPAAVQAGSRNRAAIGFDAEDFHSGEAEDAGEGKLENAIAGFIEEKLLRRCGHLTAASPLIAEKYRELYRASALPLLNVFPLTEAAEPKPAPATPGFYWFSQTIGPNRGLEEFIAILAGLKRKVRLDLRGHLAEAYGRALRQQAQGTEIELRLLPPELPQTMVANAAGYTAGLGLELRHPRNRDLCLTNKAFTYLLAGAPVILSRTAAQSRLAEELGEAALLIDLDDAKGSASQLARWLDDAGLQAAARERAFHLGRSQYNWDVEKLKFLASVHDTIARRGAVA